MRYNAILPWFTNVFIRKYLKSHIGQERNSGNSDMSPAKTRWFYEITLCLQEKCILLRKKKKKRKKTKQKHQVALLGIHRQSFKAFPRNFTSHTYTDVCVRIGMSCMSASSENFFFFLKKWEYRTSIVTDACSLERTVSLQSCILPEMTRKNLAQSKTYTRYVSGQ